MSLRKAVRARFCLRSHRSDRGDRGLEALALQLGLGRLRLGHAAQVAVEPTRGDDVDASLAGDLGSAARYNVRATKIIVAVVLGIGAAIGRWYGIS